MPLPKAPPKPKNDVPLPSIPIPESTPWPGAGKMSGNLLEDRNWLLPPNYLDNAKENKTENELKAMNNVTSPKPQIKEEESKTGEQPTEKCGWGPGCPFSNLKNRRKRKTRCSHKSYHLKQSNKPQDQKH